MSITISKKQLLKTGYQYLALLKAHPVLALCLAGISWVLIYANLSAISNAIIASFPVDQQGHLAETLRFLIFEAPKVLMLLVAVVMVMGIINTWFTPEHTRKILANNRGGTNNIFAALLGIVTPFCSCSAVPLFLGFVKAGIPLGVTFSFLIAAPMVNEVALTLLFALTGWKVALLYLSLGLSVAIISGWVIGKLKMESQLEDWINELSLNDANIENSNLTMVDRLNAGVNSVKEIVGRVWPYIVIGVAIGAGIHGYVPQTFMAGLMGKDSSWWSVPVAILIGVPMYSNAAGIIPIVEALLAKGAALGTSLAFMMSVIALSFPEMVILRKILKPKLIAVFIGVVSSGILLVGFVFNAVL